MHRTPLYGAQLVCDDALGQKNRLRIHGNEFSKSDSCSLRPYTLREVRVRACAAWGMQDFIPAIMHIIDESRACGHSLCDAEKQIMEYYELYCIPGFIQSIKTLKSYRSHIKELYQRLLDNEGYLYFERNHATYI